MEVMIGVDPHKASHTAVAVGSNEDELASKKVRATRNQVAQLLAWAEPFPTRTWAIESAFGLGFLLAQQLIGAGETVIDVPATLVSRSRVLATGRSNKTDPNDALSVAVTALRNRSLRRVEPVDHSDLLRLLFRRNMDIGNLRSRTVSRLHALLVELQPGGISREIKASDVHRFLERVTPATPVEQVRFDLASELLVEIERLDGQLKISHKRIRDAVAVANTSVTDIFGVGPVIAAAIIGYSGDVGRFANRDHYAAYNGTAPREVSSGGRTVHRLSRRGNRRLNHAIHMVAITQIRFHGTDGRAYFERRVAEGKTKREAIRSLKRHISNAVYQRLLDDARRR
jgi:transposase